jgi:hypothetical protein
MKTSALVFALPIAALMHTAAQSQTATPMTEADCTAWLTKVDANTDGALDATEGKAFQDKLTAGNMKTADATKMTKEEFMQHCQAGVFTGIAMPQ